MGINYYKGRVCLNVLGGSLKNAEEIYEAAEKYVLVGVLSANYPDVPSAVEDMEKYMDVLEGNLSVGLGGGNPAQWKAVGDIAKEIKANHFNQDFPRWATQEQTWEMTRRTSTRWYLPAASRAL